MLFLLNMSLFYDFSIRFDTVLCTQNLLIYFLVVNPWNNLYEHKIFYTFPM